MARQRPPVKKVVGSARRSGPKLQPQSGVSAAKVAASPQESDGSPSLPIPGGDERPRSSGIARNPQPAQEFESIIPLAKRTRGPHSRAQVGRASFARGAFSLLHRARPSARYSITGGTPALHSSASTAPHPHGRAHGSERTAMPPSFQPRHGSAPSIPTLASPSSAPRPPPTPKKNSPQNFPRPPR